jgi:hypothetical protein
MIGILAYGSLIDDPGGELAAITAGRTNNVITPFSVEYARSSKGRAGAPTIVPVERAGSQVRAVIFSVATSIEEAANVLYRREINQVGSGKVYRVPPPHQTDAVRIDHFEGLAGYDLVLSARLSQTIDPVTADALADLAIASARALSDGRDGISYLAAAQANGIVTPLTPAYEAAVLAKTGTTDLATALAAVRAATSLG